MVVFTDIISTGPHLLKFMATSFSDEADKFFSGSVHLAEIAIIFFVFQSTAQIRQVIDLGLICTLYPATFSVPVEVFIRVYSRSE